MIKNLHRRKLSRPSSHRRALLRNMATSLFKYEKIKTTYPKAKELSWFADKIITLVKRNTLDSRRRVYAEIRDKDVRKKLYEVIASRYANKNSGYTAVYRAGIRKSDSAQMALIVLTQ